MIICLSGRGDIVQVKERLENEAAQGVLYLSCSSAFRSHQQPRQGIFFLIMVIRGLVCQKLSHFGKLGVEAARREWAGCEAGLRNGSPPSL